MCTLLALIEGAAMKTTIQILSLFLIAVACEKESSTPPANIVGTWLTVSVTRSACDDSTENGTETCTTCQIYVYAANGTGTIDYRNGTITPFTYTISGSTLSVTVTPVGGASATGTYDFTVSATTLTREYVDAATMGQCTFTWTYARQ